MKSEVWNGLENRWKAKPLPCGQLRERECSGTQTEGSVEAKLGVWRERKKGFESFKLQIKPVNN